MEYRKLGDSDVTVSAITFGAWAIGGWMWGEQNHDDAIAAIRTSLDAGITTIDTAAIYGFGHSEELIAQAIAGRGDEVVIMTKFGLRWDGEEKGEVRWHSHDLQGRPVAIRKYASPESVILECERSLSRLGRDYIDVFQIHWPDDSTPVEETFGALDKLMQQGKIRAVGASNFPPELLARAQAVVPLACSQPPFSMVLREANNDVIPWCIDNSVGVVAYSPLQRGLLTGKIKPGHEFAEDDHRRENFLFTPVNIERINALLDKIRPIAEAHSATLAQLAINWTTRQPGITAALVGARNTTQASENAKALDFTLSDDEMKLIDKHLDELTIEKAS